MNAPMDDEARLLRELADEYRQHLAASIVRMRERIAESGARSADEDTAREVFRELHSISGAAKMFGLPRVGELARAAQDWFEPHCASGKLPEGAERDRFIDLLDAIEGEIGAARD